MQRSILRISGVDCTKNRNGTDYIKGNWTSHILRVSYGARPMDGTTDEKIRSWNSNLEKSFSQSQYTSK